MVDENLFIHRLLENERLPRDFNDDSAQALMRWAIARVKKQDFADDDRNQRQLERVIRRISNLLGRLCDSTYGERLDRFKSLVEDLMGLPGFADLEFDEVLIQFYLTKARFHDQKSNFESLMALLTMGQPKADESSPSNQMSRSTGSVKRKTGSLGKISSRSRMG
jgi:hypothetical protein